MNALDFGRTFPDRDASPAAAARDQIRESAPSGSVRLGNKRKGAAAKPRAGERLILMCWCQGAPLDKPCHGDLIKAQIERLLAFTCD